MGARWIVYSIQVGGTDVECIHVAGIKSTDGRKHITDQ